MATSTSASTDYGSRTYRWLRERSSVFARDDTGEVRQLVQQQHIEAVIFFSSDRLTRNPVDGDILRRELRQYGAELHDTTHGAVDDTPEAELFSAIEDSFNAYWCNRGCNMAGHSLEPTHNTRAPGHTHITIIGMGLIGSSLGMAIREANEKEALLGPTVITGYDQNRRATGEARGRLAIDREARSLEDALRDAQLVITAVPVQSMQALFGQIAPLLPNGAVVSDVASTKTQVLEWARELLPATVEFIGGHPMAGKERSGATAADPDIFKGAIYCLTPSPRARQTAINLIEAMIAQIHAKVYYIDAAEHDAYVAGVSHLPFMLSTALADLVSRSPAWKEMAPLAATGFRDISRLASGDALMHRDICMTNRDALARWLNEAAQWLLDARDLIEAGDADQLLDMFTRAREAREAWLTSRPNLRPGEDAFENISGVTPERPSLLGRIGRRR